MKNILIAAVALSAVSAPAFAQTSTISGTVAPFCTTGLTDGTINLNAISTGVGALNASVINNATRALSTEFLCNGLATDVSVNASDFIGTNVPSTAAIAAGFTNVVTYTATITKTGFASTPLSATALAADASGGGATVQPVGLVKSPLGLALSGAALPNGTSILVAGDYVATVVVGATPRA